MAKKKDMFLSVKQDQKEIYKIYFEDSFKNLPNYLGDMKVNERKLCIVTDSNVETLYAAEVKSLLEPVAKYVTVYAFPAGEQNKNLDTVKDLYEYLITQQFERGDMLIALGGGVVGDLTGFAAATYLRGIDFIQVPTTLLAQVDSSIGGKTGVDFDAYKNMVGAFNQPKMVYMNMASLLSLTDEQFYCGMGEVLKHGLIKDEAYYIWTIEHLSEIAERDVKTLSKMIEKSCRIKRAVVEKDPTEKGERKLLNFGHTIGHSIEKLLNGTMLHGQCVALGCVAAAYISFKREYLTAEEFFEIRDMNVGFDLPITVAALDTEEIIAVSKSDKKMKDGQLQFILLKGIGNAVVDSTVTDEELREAIDTINADAIDAKND